MNSKTELTPKQKGVKRTFLSKNSFYLNFFIFQNAFELWAEEKLNAPDFANAYTDLKNDFSAQATETTNEFITLLKDIRYSHSAEPSATVDNFINNHPKLVELIDKHKNNFVMTCFMNDAQDIKRILSYCTNFYINFAFFYDEFAQWIQTKHEVPDLLNNYQQMGQDFWSCITRENYDTFIEALLLIRNNKQEMTTTIKTLLNGFPDLAKLLVKYENSPLISEFNKEISHDQKGLDELIDKAIETYSRRKTQSPGGSPETNLKNEPELPKDNLSNPKEEIKGRTAAIFYCGTCAAKSDVTNPMYDKMGETISYLAHMTESNFPEEEFKSYIIVDGPGTNTERRNQMLGTKPNYSIFRGIVFGAGTIENEEHALLWLQSRHLPNRPDPEEHWILKRMDEGKERGPITRVVITGWSRGSVEAIETANKMYETPELKHIEVVLVLFDPVPGKFNAARNNRLLHSNVKQCTIFLSQDELSACFEPVIPERAPGNITTQIECYTAPGHHGTIVGNPFYRDMDKISNKPLLIEKSIEIPLKDHQESHYNLKAVGILFRDLAEKAIIQGGFKLSNNLQRVPNDDDVIDRDFEHMGIVVNRSRPTELRLTHKQQGALAAHIKYNLAGYRKVKGESYTGLTIAKNNRRITYGNRNTLVYHLLSDVDYRGRVDENIVNDEENLKGTLIAGRVKTTNNNLYNNFLKQLKAKLDNLKSSDALGLGFFISTLHSDHFDDTTLLQRSKELKQIPRHEYKGLIKQFYDQHHITPYQYLEILPPDIGAQFVPAYAICMLHYVSLMAFKYGLDSKIMFVRNAILEVILPKLPFYLLSGLTEELTIENNYAEFVRAFSRLHIGLTHSISTLENLWSNLFVVNETMQSPGKNIIKIVDPFLIEGTSSLIVSKATRSFLPDASLDELISIAVADATRSSLPKPRLNVLINACIAFHAGRLGYKRLQSLWSNLVSTTPKVEVLPPLKIQANSAESQQLIQAPAAKKQFDFNFYCQSIKNYWDSNKHVYLDNFQLIRLPTRDKFKHLDETVTDSFATPSNNNSLAQLKTLHYKTNEWLTHYQTKWFNGDYSSRRFAVRALHSMTECAIYYKNLDKTTLGNHPMVQLLDALSQFIDKKIQDKTTSTTILQMKKILAKHWDTKSNKSSIDSAQIFIDCREVINKRLNSVGNSFATRSFLFFRKRSEDMDIFYKDIAKVSLLADDASSESIGEFKNRLSGG